MRSIRLSMYRVFTVAAIAACLVSAGIPAHAADPEEAHYNVVVTLYNAGQRDAALKKIAEREALNPTDEMRARYLFARGLVWEKAGNANEARQAYTALVGKFPKAPESSRARMALVFLDYAAGDYDAVIAGASLIVPAGLNATEKHQLALMAGQAWAGKNEMRKALDYYNQAIALGADRQTLLPKLFTAYHQMGMHNELVGVSGNGIAGVKPDALAAVRAEALLALGRFAEAGAEARKVAAGGEYSAHASFTLARALIKQNMLKDAEIPLATAIKELRNPPAPASAHLALAECQLAAGKPDAALDTLAGADTKIGALPEAERKTMLEQTALLRVRAAFDSKDQRKIIRAVADARTLLPPDKLPDVVYARLFALQETGDDAGILASMKDDLPLFHGRAQDGSATLVYFAALKRAKKMEQGVALLEAFLSRRSDTPEAARARLELANAALAREDYTGAHAFLKTLTAMPNVVAHIGVEAYTESLYNSAVISVTNDRSGSIQALNALMQSKPAPELAGKALMLLGQAHARGDDFNNAAAAWRRAIEQGKGVDETDARDRLGRALLAMGDAGGARKEFETLAKLLGDETKLNRESRETWARAAYAAKDFAATAAAYGRLHESFKDAPVYAYECAVCKEKLNLWADAEKWYGIADRSRDRLPPDYAKVIAQNLARVRLQTGTGDRGAAYWLDRLGTSTTDPEFEGAIVALGKIVGNGKPGRETVAQLQKIHGLYTVESPRHYSTGAVLLQMMAAQDDMTGVQKLSGKLAADFSARQKTFAAGTWGATVAPAIFNYLKGEAERRLGNFADALGAYETVLGVYPFNEWPDAAACGAAECYAALGDTATALEKLGEVVKAGAASPASAKWVELAKKRITELSGGK